MGRQQGRRAVGRGQQAGEAADAKPPTFRSRTPGTDQVGKMPYKTLSELGLHRMRNCGHPSLFLVLEDRQGCCHLLFQGEGSLVQRQQSWSTSGVIV